MFDEDATERDEGNSEMDYTEENKHREENRSLDPNNEDDFAILQKQIVENQKAYKLPKNYLERKENSSKGKTPRMAEIAQNVPSEDLKAFIRSKEDIIRKLKFEKQLFLPPNKVCPLEYLREVLAGTKKVRSLFCLYLALVPHNG